MNGLPPSHEPVDRVALIRACLAARTTGGLNETEIMTLLPYFSLDRRVSAHAILVQPDRPVRQSTLLLEGFLCRYMDDRKGLRQLVALHVPGEFVDLHAYTLKSLDHVLAALTPARFVTIDHDALDELLPSRPPLWRKLWFSTTLDAALHRAWTFRLGRLDAVGRVAHFFCESSARLAEMGLSDGTRFELGVRQSDLAEICGLTSVHISRVLRQLRDMDLCRYEAPFVHIVDPEGLARRGDFKSHYLYRYSPFETDL